MTGRTNCLRCGRSDWVPYGHWRICANCDPKFVEQIVADHKAWAPKVELFDKGLPSKPGGK